MSTAAADQPLGTLETVATFEGPMPTGVTVSHTGRVFVNFPKWGDDVTATVMEVRDGECVPYPDQASNDPAHDADDRALVSVQSVVVDPLDRLWALDTGSPQFQRTQVGGPKLVCIDLATDTVVQTIVPPREVALEATYLNDIRFDLRRGEAGTAFITDSSDGGANGIVVVDLASGQSLRRLHDHPSTKPESLDTFRPVIEGRPWMVRPPDGPPRPVGLGSDGIAISSDGARLYYCPFTSRRLWSVSVDALLDPSLDDDGVAATVIAEGDKGSASDGLETDDAGRLYATAYEHNAILRRLADGQWDTVVHDPRLLFPDTLSVGTDRHLYVTANQLHRQAAYQGGKDLRERPYHVFRTPIDAGPVLLRPAAGS
ncbi:L-dopachrome tautomerase-related protein [Pseudonocardia nantongensis]|uniref:L-dopachrome tautomerase-related protein n=1 Tax=Pseudonocardia nantongensis TaxID=1181885 RepID=UPI003978A141